MKLSQFKFNLPDSLIAHTPANSRDESRLMVLHRDSGKIEHKIGKFDFRALGKAQAIGKLQGFVKVITDMNNVIIGAAIIGAHASDLLAELTLAVQYGLTSEQVGDVIHPHPTLSEAIMEACHDVNGECVHAAKK